MAKRTVSKEDLLIESIYDEHCKGLAIPITKLSEIYYVGRRSISEGNSLEVTTQRIIEVAKRLAE